MHGYCKSLDFIVLKFSGLKLPMNTNIHTYTHVHKHTHTQKNSDSAVR